MQGLKIAYLFEKGLAAPPSSCDGEPAPDREAPVIFPDDVIPGGKPKGDLKVALAVGSVGELLAVGEPERGCRTADGRYPRVGCSDLEDVIIDTSRLGQPCAFCGSGLKLRPVGSCSSSVVMQSIGDGIFVYGGACASECRCVAMPCAVRRASSEGGKDRDQSRIAN